MLQWGRSLIPAEGSDAELQRYLSRVASMGPQFNPCGRKVVDVVEVVALAASMGPQFNPCGR